MDATDTFEQAGFSPGEDATQPAEGGRATAARTRGCSPASLQGGCQRRAHGLKSVKQECDREPLCDGVNKYWTSDLWHISSSGEAPGCDVSLRDGYGTDASAFTRKGRRALRCTTRTGLATRWTSGGTRARERGGIQ